VAFFVIERLINFLNQEILFKYICVKGTVIVKQMICFVELADLLW
jgi:hypothetical protein